MPLVDPTGQPHYVGLTLSPGVNNQEKTEQKVPHPQVSYAHSNPSFNASPITLNPEEQERRLSRTLDSISSQDLNAKTLTRFIDEEGDKVIKCILESRQRVISKEGEVREVKVKVEDPIDISFLHALDALAHQIAMSYESTDLVGLHMHEGGFHVLSKGTAPLELGIVLADMIGQGGVLIAMSALVKKAEQVLQAKKQALETTPGHLDQEVEGLSRWIDIQRQLLKKQKENTAVTVTLATPMVISSLGRFFHSATSAIGAAFGWLSIGALMITAAWEWRHAHKDVKEHQAWTVAFQNSGSSAEDVQKIIDKQKAVFEANLLQNLPAFQDKILNPALDLIKKAEDLDPFFKEDAVNNIIRIFKSNHLALATEKPSFEELSTDLKNPDRQAEWNKQMVQNKEELSVSLRNALRSLFSSKSEIDKGFLKVKLNKAKALFSATIFIAALAIVFKILMILGVASVGVLLVASGYGIMAAVLGLAIFGLVYLYVKKPNLFKTYLKGIQAKLLWKEIPLAVQSYRRQYVLFEMSKRLLNKEKTDGLEKKLKKLDASIKNNEEKIRKLKKKVEEAGWKDYHQRLYGHGEYDGADAHTRVAEGLLKDLPDSETEALLVRMNIDLSAVKNQSDSNEVESAVAQIVQTFFAMDEQDTLKMIRKQRLLADYG